MCMEGTAAGRSGKSKVAALRARLYEPEAQARASTREAVNACDRILSHVDVSRDVAAWR